eukprot:172282-Pelagomonas_calceolata.AAC.2
MCTYLKGIEVQIQRLVQYPGKYDQEGDDQNCNLQQYKKNDLYLHECSTLSPFTCTMLDGLTATGFCLAAPSVACAQEILLQRHERAFDRKELKANSLPCESP